MTSAVGLLVGVTIEAAKKSGLRGRAGRADPDQIPPASRSRDLRAIVADGDFHGGLVAPNLDGAIGRAADTRRLRAV